MSVLAQESGQEGGQYPVIISKSVYKAKIFGTSSKLLRTIEQQDENLFRAYSSSRNGLYSIKEVCSFRYAKNGTIQPLEYSYKLKYPFGGRKQQVTFDWERMKVRATYKKKTLELDIEAGYQVDLTMQLQLQKELQKGTKEFEVTIVRKHSTRQYRYEVIGTEAIELNDTVYDALLMERNTERKQVKVWVNPADDYKMLKTHIRSSKDPDVQITFQKTII